MSSCWNVVIGLSLIVLIPGFLMPIFMKLMRGGFGPPTPYGFFNYTAWFAFFERLTLSALVLFTPLSYSDDRKFVTGDQSIAILAGWVALKLASGWGDGKSVGAQEGESPMSDDLVRKNRQLSLLGSVMSLSFCYFGARLISQSDWFVGLKIFVAS